MKTRTPILLIGLACNMLLPSQATLAHFSQQGPKLVGTGAAGGACQGESVSFSADGNTAIVGGPCDNRGDGVGPPRRDGAAWIWTRSGEVWTQQGFKLVGSGAVGDDVQQGLSVALSGDGNTAIVGGPGDNGFAGAAWVWTRSGGVWTQQGPKLVASGAVGNGFLGWSVSLSGDGNTAMVGGPEDNDGSGAVWVWTRSGGVWTQQGPKLVGSGAVGRAYQGSSVSLSADGNTAIVGGYGDNGFAGAVWVWTRNGGVWSQQGPKLVGSGAVGKAYQGWSVSLSGEGNTAIVGGIGDNKADGAPVGVGVGAAWVWTRSGGVWTQQGAKLVASDAVGPANQGQSVSLSTDGNTAVVVGGRDNEAGGVLGAAWIWTRSGGGWVQQGSKLVGSGGFNMAEYRSADLSADGNNVIVGGPLDQFGNGAAWVWTRSDGVWTQQGTKLVGSGAGGIAAQGESVALSADGNTAIVGGSLDNGGDGAAWIWTRSGGVWSQQGGKLVGSGAAGPFPSRQGTSVAISGDGNTAIVGGPYDDDLAGAVWIWTRTGGVWIQQGSKLVGSGAGGEAFQGVSVAISADGNTAIAVGPLSYGYFGAAWVWTRSGGIWTQQGTKLVGTSAMNGGSVALSGDGNTAIIGGEGDSDGVGAAWVWTRSGGVWSQQGPKLVGSGAVGNAHQGWSVSLSGDGNTAIVGGPADNGADGAAWVWTRSGGVWTQQGTKLVGSGAVDPAQQGYSVSLSGDGNTAIVVGSRDNEAGGVSGAAWVWTRSGGVWVQQGSKLVGSGVSGGAQYVSACLSGDGNTAIVGGNQDNGFTGAAWIFASSTAVPPTVSSVTPPTGSTAGGTSVTISGTGFQTGATATVGVASATDVNVLNATTITDGGSGSLSDAYSYVAPSLSVTGISPKTGVTSGGTLVTISGTGFVDGAAVSFRGAPAMGVVFQSATSMRADTPARPVGPADVVVSNPEGASAKLPGGFLYSATGSATRLYSMTPCRVIDTRNPAGPYGGPALAALTVRSFDLAAGACNVPGDAAGISLNVTVADATSSGSLTMYPGVGAIPGTNTITFAPGKNRANNVQLGLVGGAFSVYNDQSTGNVHLIVDVNGYFR
jgi:hypothetical protein